MLTCEKSVCLDKNIYLFHDKSISSLHGKDEIMNGFVVFLRSVLIILLPGLIPEQKEIDELKKKNEEYKEKIQRYEQHIIPAAFQEILELAKIVKFLSSSLMEKESALKRREDFIRRSIRSVKNSVVQLHERGTS